MNLKDIAWLDTETTGLDVENDRIVELAIVRGNSSMLTRFSPGYPMPPEAEAIHGISDADLVGMGRFTEERGVAVLKALGRIVGGYNIIGYDLPLLEAELRRVGLVLPNDLRVIDLKPLYFKMHPRHLSDCYREYTGEELVDAHHAIADADACARIFPRMIERHTQDIPQTIEEMHAECMGDRVDWQGKLVRLESGDIAINFGKHQGTPLREVPRDYLHWMLDKDFSAKVKTHVRRSL